MFPWASCLNPGFAPQALLVCPSVWNLDEKPWLGPGGTLPSAGRWSHLRLRAGRGGSLGRLERGEKSPPSWQTQVCHRSDEFRGLSFLHHHHILPENQPVDRLHLSSAQHNLFRAPQLGMCLLVTLECSGVLDQADCTGTLVPQTTGMCVTESVRAASVEEASVREVIRGWRGR